MADRIVAEEPQRALRSQFISVFLLAATGSVALVALGRVWLPAIWASGWMIAYGFIAFRRSPELARTDEFGDSYYYLGFILTLVALIVVLVSLGTDAEPESILDRVLPQFGLALSTTLVGLVGRTVLTMFQPEPSSVQERAERRISRAFDDYAAALERLTTDIDSFERRFSQELNESILSLKGTVDQFNDLVATSSEEAKPLIEQLQSATGDLEESSQRLSEASGEVASGIEESREVIAARTEQVDEELANWLEAVGETSRAVEDSGKELSTAIGTTASGIEKMGDIEDRLDSLVSSLGALTDAFDRTGTATTKGASTIETSMDEIADSVTGIQAELEAVTQTVGAQRKQLEAVLQNLSDQIGELGRMQEKLQEESSEAASALLEVRKDLAAGVRFLRQTMES